MQTETKNQEKTKEARTPPLGGNVKFTITWADLHRFVSAVHGLRDEAVARLEPDGWLVAREVDYAHVAMGEVRVKTAALEGVSETVRVALDIVKVKQFLESFQKYGPHREDGRPGDVEVGVDLVADAQRVVLTCGGMIRSMLTTPGSGESWPKWVKLGHAPGKPVSGAVLEAFANHAGLVNDHMLLVADRGVLSLSVNDEEKDRLVVSVPFESEKRASAAYSLDYASRIVGKLILFGGEIMLAFADDKPFEAAAGDGSGSAKFMLAPRIEAD